MAANIQLGAYDNSWYSPGRSMAYRAAWMFVGQPLFGSPLLPSSAFRVALLRAFGARIGNGVVIHSNVAVKYPWHLVVGNDCWIGERAWIDNLCTVRLGDNVCISQGAYLCTGNHDWADPIFGLMIRGVELKDASWAGAKSVLLPGVVLHEGAIAGAGSVVNKSIPSWEIHAGNPATFLRTRELRGVRSMEEVSQ